MARNNSTTRRRRQTHISTTFARRKTKKKVPPRRFTKRETSKTLKRSNVDTEGQKTREAECSICHKELGPPGKVLKVNKDVVGRGGYIDHLVAMKTMYELGEMFINSSLPIDEQIDHACPEHFFTEESHWHGQTSSSNSLTATDQISQYAEQMESKNSSSNLSKFHDFSDPYFDDPIRFPTSMNLRLDYGFDTIPNTDLSFNNAPSVTYPIHYFDPFDGVTYYPKTENHMRYDKTLQGIPLRWQEFFDGDLI